MVTHCAESTTLWRHNIQSDRKPFHNVGKHLQISPIISNPSLSLRLLMPRNWKLIQKLKTCQGISNKSMTPKNAIEVVSIVRAELNGIRKMSVSVNQPLENVVADLYQYGQTGFSHPTDIAALGGGLKTIAKDNTTK